MLIESIIPEYIVETVAWARSGKKIVRKVRCGSGPRKGKVVANSKQCHASKDIQKSITLKRTKAKKGSRMAKKAKKTKRLNAVAKRVNKMNKDKK